LKRSALLQSADFGWAKITHPFHPLRGQSFRVLKARRVAGKDTLILQGTPRGSFAVPREWTDHGDPCLYASHKLPVLSLECLQELLEMVDPPAGERGKEGS
jgi:hypothetical protein